jgi:hydroxymethylbilane synthase
MRNKTLYIGTRGSRLAMYQAESVMQALRESIPGLHAEIKIIKTKGDRIIDVALSKIGDKGLFTKELETELLNHNIDIAVHSLKDLPTGFPDGLALGGVLPRGEFRDALVHIDGKKLSELSEKDIIATSSLRRRAQLLRHNPSFTVTDIRGNVNTRLQKMQDGHCTAMIMAAAGLQRLGLDHVISEILDPLEFIPAPGQGAIAMEIREHDTNILEMLRKINHEPTLRAVTAERIFLKMLEGGCQVPIGCFTYADDNSFWIEGYLSSPDGKVVIRDNAGGRPAGSEEIAIRLARTFLERGAGGILDQIRKTSPD